MAKFNILEKISSIRAPSGLSLISNYIKMNSLLNKDVHKNELTEFENNENELIVENRTFFQNFEIVTQE